MFFGQMQAVSDFLSCFVSFAHKALNNSASVTRFVTFASRRCRGLAK